MQFKSITHFTASSKMDSIPSAEEIYEQLKAAREANDKELALKIVNAGQGHYTEPETNKYINYYYNACYMAAKKEDWEMFFYIATLEDNFQDFLDDWYSPFYAHLERTVGYGIYNVDADTLYNQSAMGVILQTENMEVLERFMKLIPREEENYWSMGKIMELAVIHEHIEAIHTMIELMPKLTTQALVSSIKEGKLEWIRYFMGTLRKHINVRSIYHYIWDDSVSVEAFTLFGELSGTKPPQNVITRMIDWNQLEKLELSIKMGSKITKTHLQQAVRSRNVETIRLIKANLPKSVTSEMIDKEILSGLEWPMSYVHRGTLTPEDFLNYLVQLSELMENPSAIYLRIVSRPSFEGRWNRSDKMPEMDDARSEEAEEAAADEEEEAAADEEEDAVEEEVEAVDEEEAVEEELEHPAQLLIRERQEMNEGRRRHEAPGNGPTFVQVIGDTLVSIGVPFTEKEYSKIAKIKQKKYKTILKKWLRDSTWNKRAFLLQLRYDPQIPLVEGEDRMRPREFEDVPARGGAGY
jgi:hypothetical protein